MTDCIVKVGEKLHISSRRNFDGAARRTFIGDVVATQRDVVRIQGWLFIYHPEKKTYVRKGRMQTRIIGISNGFNHITVLPPLLRIENLTYYSRNGEMVVTDGLTVHFEVTEAGPSL